MPRPSSTCRAELLALHNMYADFNQLQPSDCELMVLHGHPRARPYRRLRRFFDRLRFACNASARLYTYAGRDERSEFHAPGLTLSWYPEGALSRFGHVYPAHENWPDYIRAAAAVKWAGADPELEPASWHIATRSRELADRLEHLGQSHDLAVRSASAPSGATGLVLGDVRDIEQLSAVANTLRQYQAPHVLPPRTKRDDEADRRELPLHERRFALAAVSKVTVTPRMLLVPLIPAGDEAAAKSAVDDVVARLARGYPLAGARTWLKSVLTPDSYRRLLEKFGNATPVFAG